MNDSLDRWLTNRGYTGTLNDKQRQYLSDTTAGDVTDALNDLWRRWGDENGAPYPTTVTEVQRLWAIFQGATSTLTWNDAMGTLPP